MFLIQWLKYLRLMNLIYDQVFINLQTKILLPQKFEHE